MDANKPLWAAADGVYLRIAVVPRAGRDEIVGPAGDSIRIRLKAPPIEGRANEALVAFLSECLDLPRSALRLVSGTTARRKVVCISGLSVDEATQRLLAR